MAQIHIYRVCSDGDPPVLKSADLLSQPRLRRLIAGILVNARFEHFIALVRTPHTSIGLRSAPTAPSNQICVYYVHLAEEKEHSFGLVLKHHITPHSLSHKMVSLHPNNVTVVASHPFEWYEEHGWEHELEGVRYQIIKDSHDLRAALRGDEARLVTTFVRQMDGVFRRWSFNPDVSTWDVANVTDMRGMFYDAEVFNGDLSAWNVANVTDMGYMFYEAVVFNGDLSPGTSPT